MTHPTDIETFQARLQSQPELIVLLDRIVDDAGFDESMTAARVADPLSAGLSLVAVAALWKLLGVGIDTLRRMSEDVGAKRRIQLIRELQDLGYQRQAPFIVGRLLKEMRERPDDDPVLKKLMEL